MTSTFMFFPNLLERLMFRSAVSSIRVKVDEMYRKLHRLCDMLDEKPQVSYDPNPHGLRISESNELLDGLKTLFAESDVDEQVRLMTIAPKEWGSTKKSKNGTYSILISFHFFTSVQSYVTENFYHLLGFNQSQIRPDDRSFFEKIKEC